METSNQSMSPADLSWDIQGIDYATAIKSVTGDTTTLQFRIGTIEVKLIFWCGKYRRAYIIKNAEYNADDGTCSIIKISDNLHQTTVYHNNEVFYVFDCSNQKVLFDDELKWVANANN